MDNVDRLRNFELTTKDMLSLLKHETWLCSNGPIQRKLPPLSSISENKQTVTYPIFNAFQTHLKGLCPDTIPARRAVRGLNVSVEFTALYNELGECTLLVYK